METLKVKSALFNLMAIMVLSISMSSCEYDLVERLDPSHYINQPVSPISTTASNDDATFRTILEASKGKLQLDKTGRYEINLTYNDLGRIVYKKLNNANSLTVSKGFTIPGKDVATIFCLTENLCLAEGDFKLKKTEFTLERSESTGLCFKVGQIWICMT